MSGEMLERRFITINTVDKFHFVECLGQREKPVFQEVIKKSSAKSSVIRRELNVKECVLHGLLRVA